VVRKLFVIFLLSLSIAALAQQVDSSDPVPMTKMVMRNWTGDDGLISNNLTSVSQTSDGFIWVTSFNGVHRFDGATFKLYDKENVDFLKTNAFYQVTNDAHGVLLASQGSGVVMYLNGELTPADDFPVSSVRRLLVDSQNRYWCGTNNEGLYKATIEKTVKVDHEAFDQVSILDIYEDSRGRIWFATEGKGLVKFENDEYEWYTTDNLLDDNTVTTVLEADSGEIILGTLSGLYVLNNDFTLAEQVSGLEDTYINDVVRDSTNMLWVATEQGVYRTHLQTGYFELFDESMGLPSNQVSSIIIDHESSIWLSTKKSGLIRMNLGSVISLGKMDGIRSTRINSIVENEGRVFVGSDDGSIFVKDGADISSIDLTTKQRQVGIRDFMFDGDDLWVASYLGLHRYSNGKEEVMTTEEGLSSNLIRKILKTKDGSIWLASRSGGVMKLKNNKVVEIYNADTGLLSNFILALAQDNEGNIVVGTHSGGISIISQDTVRTYVPEIGGIVVFNVYVDEKNRYWLSTSVGVFVFEDGTFQMLEFDTSFKTEAIFDFVPDKAGNVWLPTNIGIICVSQKQVLDFSNGSIDKVEGLIFDQNDGMTIRECTGATRSTLLANGEVWIPTLDGIAIVDPQNIRHNTRVPQIVITSFVADGDMIMDKASIAPGKLRYEFIFASTSYLASDRVRFKYRLVGVNDHWIETSEHKIEYTNLAPGTYTFSVIGSNNDGIWNETGDVLTFTVEPFYYQTLLFKIVLGLFVVLLSYNIFIWRVRRVKAINKELSKVNEELDRFVYSASHDIRAPLTSIMGVAHIAKESATLEEKNECLAMIESSADKLDGFIRDIIDYSRNQRLELVLEEVSMKEELTSILDSLKYLDEAGKVSCTITCIEDSFRTDIRRLRVILKNIIANAFFYADTERPNPYVKIDCSIQRARLVITISDNGLGMEEEIQKDIFSMFFRGHTDSKGSGLGLFIAKENIEKLGGEIEVTSKVREGTTFTIVVPMTEG